jgi:peptidyl-prolyl cis-trans isomerase SurA
MTPIYNPSHQHKLAPRTLLSIAASALAVVLLAQVPAASHAQMLEQPSIVSGNSVESIVALVEDDVVLQSELDAAVDRVRSQFSGKENQLPPVNILQRQVLERLIVNKLQVLRAEETGVQVTDTEVDQAVVRVAQTNQLTTEQLQAALARDGVRLSDFRKSMREEILVQKLRGRVVQSRADVSESEIDIAMASSSLKKGELNLSHVLVGLPDNATAEQVETAKKKIDGIRELISDGKMEFSAAAIRYSDDQNTALSGGGIGWRRFDQIPPSFAEALNGLKAGDLTNPVRSTGGFHLIKIVDARENAQVMVTEYNARHIIINVDELTSDAEAEKTIRGIHDQVTSKNDFEDQAKKYSDDAQTAALGGDMGWFDLQQYGSTYADTISALKDQQYSQPFRTEQGWHVVQRLGTRELDRTRDYERSQVRESIRERKADEAFEQFIRQLRNEAYVENRLEKSATDDPNSEDSDESDAADQAKEEVKG